MSSNDLKNERRNEPLHLSVDIKTEPSISSMQEDFALCEADYLRLKNGKSKGSDVAITFFLASIGFGIAFAAKYVASLFDGKTFLYETWEWVAPAIAATISLVIYLVYLCLPNDHKRVMKAVEEHFKTAPRTRHIKEAKNEK